MDILDRYSALRNYKVETVPVKRFEQVKPEPLHLLSDVKPVTIAEIHPASQEVITAHSLKDYRRKTFSLMLLPDVPIMLDRLLDRVGDINDCIEFKR